MRIEIKPLSVNEAWKGRRFKTNEYKAYEKEIIYRLPVIVIPAGRLVVHLEFGVSSAGFDWDNAIKPFMDVLQKRYQFNDNRIYKAEITKTLVKKGEEFIEFSITGKS